MQSFSEIIRISSALDRHLEMCAFDQCLDYDYAHENMNELPAITSFTWPDTGQNEIQEMKFRGAVLNEEVNDIGSITL